MNCPVCENRMREHVSHYKCSKCKTVMNKTHRKADLRKQVESEIIDPFFILKRLWKFVFLKIAGEV
jgi:tRNA(Ile2) C34 agmatinyltransferase TiaS